MVPPAVRRGDERDRAGSTRPPSWPRDAVRALSTGQALLGTFSTRRPGALGPSSPAALEGPVRRTRAPCREPRGRQALATRGNGQPRCITASSIGRKTVLRFELSEVPAALRRLARGRRWGRRCPSGGEAVVAEGPARRLADQRPQESRTGPCAREFPRRGRHLRSARASARRGRKPRKPREGAAAKAFRGGGRWVSRGQGPRAAPTDHRG